MTREIISLFVFVALGAWVGRALALVLFMALVRPSTPCYTGFRIVMPASYLERLNHQEQVAVYAHEQGHRHHLHVWRNYFRALFWIKFTDEDRKAQEFQADDYVIEMGLGAHLAAALLKVSCHEFDVYRANRILRIVAFKTADDLILNLCKV